MRWLLVGLAVVFFLVSVAGALAQPVFQGSDSNAGALVLDILYPKIDMYGLDDVVNLHFQVFNETGRPVFNDSISCYVHLYDSHDGLIREEQLVYDGPDFKFPNTNTSPAGFYSFNVWCNGSIAEGGYTTGYYWVAEDGAEERGSSPSGIIFLAIIPLILALFLLVGGVSLSNEAHPVVKIFLFLVSFPLAFASMQLGSMAVSRFYNFPEVVDAMGQFTFWFVILWGVLVTYFIIYGLVMMFRQAAQDEKERLSY